MRLRLTVIAALATLAAVVSQPVLAQDRAFAFSLTGGAGVAPSYFGSDSYTAAPALGFSFTGLSLGGFRLGDADGPRHFAEGTGLRGAFRYIGEREGRDELAGLNDVDASLELGLGLQHTAHFWQVYGDLRYGVIGHEGIVGEIGANAIYRGQDGMILHAGPRVEVGNARFARTYFGVTEAEAAVSAFDAYTPDSGVHSVGFEIGLYQPLNEDWGISGSIRYDRLRGDAADSPIVQQGSRNQYRAALGLTRHFNFRF